MSAIRDIVFGASPSDTHAVASVNTGSRDAASSFGRRRRTAEGAPAYYRKTGRAIQVGENALASGDLSAALGPFAYTEEDSGIAIGPYAKTLGTLAIAIGREAVASGYRGVSIGNLANSSGVYSISFGVGAKASGLRSVAIGTGTAATGASSTAIGDSADATAADSVAIGTNAQATDTRAVAIGVSAGATSDDTIAIGHSATASASDTIAIGQASVSSVLQAVAVGVVASVSGQAGVAVGFGSVVAHDFSVGIGYSAEPTATHQFVSGQPTGYISDVYFGSGPKTGIGAIADYTMHGSEGTGQTDKAGGTVKIAGGRSTGTGNGGEVIIQTAPSAGGSSSAFNALVDRSWWTKNGHPISAELTTNPSTTEVTSLNRFTVYMKADKFVIAYNNAGTMTYITIPMDGTTTAWTHGTAAP